MGLLDKVKNLFTEEIEEEEVPIRKEMKRVEIAKPRMETQKVVEPIRPREDIKPIEIPKKQEEMQTVSESSALNKDEKFKFPVYFDDKDFEDLPKPKEKPAFKPEIKPMYQGSSPVKVEEAKRKFMVSPVISPVYGVLDKNYNKEDIRVKPDKSTKKSHYEEKLTVDDIRNKAYGTLEDDLENTLLVEAMNNQIEETVDSGMNIFDELENTSTSGDLLMRDITFEKEELPIEKLDETSEEELKTASSLEEELEIQKQKIDELSKYITSIQTEAEVMEPTIEEPKEENIIEEIVNEEPEEIKTEETNEQTETSEGDLFSLIDSMYEKREE